MEVRFGFSFHSTYYKLCLYAVFLSLYLHQLLKDARSVTFTNFLQTVLLSNSFNKDMFCQLQVEEKVKSGRKPSLPGSSCINVFIG